MAIEIDVDALIVGAGFGGILALYKFINELKLSCKLIDGLDGPGGTWNLNRFPGALSDSPSYLYRFPWDKDLIRQHPFKNWYSSQPESLAYLEHVCDHYKLRQFMQFHTLLVDATFDEKTSTWLCTMQQTDTKAQSKIRSRYLVTAVGPLSAIKYPDIPGLNSFKGELLHSGAWPRSFDFTTKRVGVIGNGSTGVQTITALAPQVKQLISFQRSPQYTVPAADGPISEAEREKILAEYDKIWSDIMPKTAMGMGFIESTTPMFSVSKEERDRVLEEAWHAGPAGGFKFMFCFGDILMNQEANDYAANFIKNKISQIVQDPEKARKLMPREIYARRPICDSGYYQVFNRDNVDIVSLHETPITEIVPNGVKCADGKLYELDVLVCCTGFKVEGNYDRIIFKGRGGQTLRDKWQDCPATYLGIFPAGFPNMFNLLGPSGAFLNASAALEAEIQYVLDILHAHPNKTIEATEEAEQEWIETCTEVANATLFSKLDNWFFRSRKDTGKVVPSFYLGGLALYTAELQKRREAQHSGIVIS